jgi:hypothetical protein
MLGPGSHRHSHMRIKTPPPKMSAQNGRSAEQGMKTSHHCSLQQGVSFSTLPMSSLPCERRTAGEGAAIAGAAILVFSCFHHSLVGNERNIIMWQLPVYYYRSALRRPRSWHRRRHPRHRRAVEAARRRRRVGISARWAANAFNELNRTAMLSQWFQSGTLAKKRTIPHSPCSSFLFEGFPAINNLGHFDSRQDRILLIKKIWTSEVGG